MAVSKGYIDYILGQLERCGPVEARRMFGGAGLYAGGRIFALATSDEVFYLKVGPANRPDFEARGMTAFNPPMKDGRIRPGKGMPYMTVPEDVLEDPDELAIWARKAMAIG